MRVCVCVLVTFVCCLCFIVCRFFISKSQIWSAEHHWHGCPDRTRWLDQQKCLWQAVIEACQSKSRYLTAVTIQVETAAHRTSGTGFLGILCTVFKVLRHVQGHWPVSLPPTWETDQPRGRWAISHSIQQWRRRRAPAAALGTLPKPRSPKPLAFPVSLVPLPWSRQGPLFSMPIHGAPSPHETPIPCTSSWNVTANSHTHSCVFLNTSVMSHGSLLYIPFGASPFHLIYLRIYSTLTFISFSSFFLATTWCPTEWMDYHFFNQLSLCVVFPYPKYCCNKHPSTHLPGQVWAFYGDQFLRKGVAGPKGPILNFGGWCPFF